MISICYENWIVFSFQCTSSLKFRIRPFASSSRRIREVRSSYWASNKAESGLSSSFSVDFFTCSLPFALVRLLFPFFSRTRRESALLFVYAGMASYVRLWRPRWARPWQYPCSSQQSPLLDCSPSQLPTLAAWLWYVGSAPHPPHLLWRGYTLCPHPPSPPLPCSLSVAPGLADPLSSPPFTPSRSPLCWVRDPICQ